MKRKDWIIKNLKEDIYGNLNLKTKKKYIVRFRTFFLRNLYMKRAKHLIKKNLHVNYFFYRSMLTTFNFKKKNYFNSIYFNNKLTKIPFYPEFSIAKNVFNKKNKALNIFKKNNLEYFFLDNSFNKENFGLSYYFLFDSTNLKKLSIDLNDENNNNLMQFKNYTNDFYQNHIFNEMNLNFNFNLNLLCVSEIYKIITLLYLHKLN